MYRPAEHIGRKSRAAIADIAGRGQEASENFIPNGNHDRGAGSLNVGTAVEAARCLQGNGAHHMLIDMALHLGNQRSCRSCVDMERIVDRRQLTHAKLYINHGTPDGDDMPFGQNGGG